ncbi:MAG: hybrid sensor histidine kinase/response regulator [Candidatus Kapaibacteriales bacterium]
MKKILVVDDSDYILESTSVLLTLEGYEVLTAANGKEGLKLAIQERPDLILCDIQMPEMDGYTMLEYLRSNPETEAIPLIFLTAFGEKQNMREGMIRGADDYIVKPFTHDELLHAINVQWKKISNIQKKLKEKVETVGKAVTFALPHEFRTVLNEIIGSAKLIQNSFDDFSKDEILEIAGDIITTSKRLLKITENFLIYTKIEAYAVMPNKRAQLRQHFTDEPFAMLQDIAMLKAAEYGRTTDLELGEFQSNISIEIASDSFYKIIDELVDNAFKFSAPGQKVSIDAENLGNKICFKIIDQGRGIEKNMLENINTLTQFERDFYEQQGVGMGLIIAKKLIELHDGDFTIESKPGEGTKIFFTLHSIKEN